MKNADMPANPHEWRDYTEHGGEMIRETFFGLTKREYAAIEAMQGICVNSGRNGTDYHKPENIAKIAVKLADALFEELEK